MQQRFLLQLLAIVLIVILVTALSLVFLGKISALWFWIVAGVVFALTYLIYKK